MKTIENLIENCKEIYINGVKASVEDLKYLIDYIGIKFELIAFSKVNGILKMGVNQVEEKILEICKSAEISTTSYYKYCRKAKKRLTVDELKEEKAKAPNGRPRKKLY